MFDGEVGLAADLAEGSFTVMVLLEGAAIAEVGVFLRHFLQSVAGEVETGVAGVAVEHLVGVAVGAAETDLAVSLEEFLLAGLEALGRTEKAVVVDEGLQNGGGLVGVALLEVLEHGHPGEVLADLKDLGGRSGERVLLGGHG